METYSFLPMEEKSELAAPSKNFWNKNVYYVLIVLACIALLAISASLLWYFGSHTGQPLSRKTVFDSQDASMTMYPGSGIITDSIREQLLIIPLSDDRPFYAGVHERSLYDPRENQIVEIPGNDKRIKYVVGLFDSWQDIAASDDKVMVLSDPSNPEIEYLFRVAFSGESSLFGENPTILAVENMERPVSGGQLNVEKVDDQVWEIRYEGMQKLIKQGDAVIVEPVRNLDMTESLDPAARWLAKHILIRRVGGKLSVESELYN